MNGEPAYAEKAKEEKTPMKELESALETLNSCTVALEELTIKCHITLLGEFEFHLAPETDAPDRPGQISAVTILVTSTRRTIQRCIEIMQSLDHNLS